MALNALYSEENKFRDERVRYYKEVLKYSHVSRDQTVSAFTDQSENVNCIWELRPSAACK